MIHPQYGLGVLRQIQEHIPEAILAGGYLRDANLGIAPKDIDILIPYMAPRVPPAPSGGVVTLEFNGDYFGDTEVNTVFRVDGFSLPVQLIELKPGLAPKERAAKHDIGICQVWHDGVAWACTADYQADRDAFLVALRYCETAHEYERSCRRVDRLAAKLNACTRAYWMADVPPREYFGIPPACA